MRRSASAAARLIADGDRLLRERDVDGAESAYRRAWQRNPQSADAAWSIGCALSHRGDMEGSLAWACRALDLDAGHLGARVLAGNALLGLERHEEALPHLQAAGEAGHELALAQLGLCYEALRRFDAAEATLRRLLEKDLAYTTRYQPVALYDQSPFWADVHHALARVLQARGNTAEARLHYHLTKRIDPLTELDPRYLEIMSTEELEDHPFDADAVEPLLREDASDLDRQLTMLARANGYDELSATAKLVNPTEVVPQLAGIIEVAQTEGELTLAAQLRPMIDVVGGTDARALYEAISTVPWRRLLGLADRVAVGRMSVSEASDAVRGGEIPPYAALLLDLVGRFVAVESRSGMVLAEVVAAALEDRAAPGLRADAHRLIGRAQLLSGDAVHAESSFKRALAVADAAGEGATARAVLSELWEAQRERGDVTAAEATLRRGIELADAADDRDAALEARDHLAVLLLQDHRFAEAHDLALEVAEAAASGSGTADLAAHVADLLVITGHAVDTPVRAGLLDTLRRRADEERGSTRTLRQMGRRAASEGRLDEAIELLERAREEAAVDGSRADQARASLDLGEALAEAGRNADARPALEQGLRRAAPEGAAVDVWPALITLSIVCARLDEPEPAVEAAERALSVAQRGRDLDREAMTHEHLAQLLIDQQPERGIYHAGRFVRLSQGDDPDAPSAWHEGVTALREGRHTAAVDAFEDVGRHPGRYRAPALANCAAAYFALGDRAGVERALRRAADAFVEEGDGRQALRVLAQLAEIQRSSGEPVDPTLQWMRTVFDGFTEPHQRRAGGLIFGEAALHAHEHRLAEAALTDTLELATSETWRDVADELEARKLLGTTYRRVARNAEARDQYVAGIKRAVEVRDERAEADLRGRLAIALRQLGMLDEALAEYDRAIALAALHHAEDQIAVHKMNRASALFELGRPDVATASAVEAWRAFEDRGDEHLALRTLMLLRQNVDPSTLPSEAAARLDELLRGDVPDDLAPAMLARRAVAMRDRGDVDGARTALTTALDVVRARGDRVEEVRMLLNRARVLGDHEHVAAVADVREAATLARSLHNVELEVDALETGVDLVLGAGLLPEVVGRLRELDRGWSVLRQRLSRDADRVALAAHSAEGLRRCAVAFIDAEQDDVAAAVLELARARGFGDLLSATTADAGEPWADPLDLHPAAELLRDLAPGAVAVGFDILADEVVATVLDVDGGARTEVVGMEEADLDRLVDDFRQEVIAFRGHGVETWAQHAASLLACVAGALNDAAAVVLLPDGPLHELPLHAVPMPDGRPLVEHAAVVYAPSLHALAHLRRRAPIRADDANATLATVGVAFPDEARAISLRVGGPCLSGRRLNKAAVRDLAADAKVLHFACHGFFDGRTPLDSGLLLSTAMPPAIDDVLSVRDVAEWHLRSDLVTLSACETGLGRVVPADFLGLARSFAGAGARSVIASLWPVDDAPTQRLMVDLYDEIARQRRATGHVDVAAALRTAQVARAAEPLYDWAAFKVIGWPRFDWAVPS